MAGRYVHFHSGSDGHAVTISKYGLVCVSVVQWASLSGCEVTRCTFSQSARKQTYISIHLRGVLDPRPYMHFTTYISNDLGWVSWIPGPTHISNYFVWVSWIPGPTHISCTISHYPFATIIICLFLSSRSFYFITHFVRLIQKSCTTNPATRVRDPIQFQFPLISFESATQSLPYPMSSYHEFLRLFVQFNNPVTNKSCHSGL